MKLHARSWPGQEFLAPRGLITLSAGAAMAGAAMAGAALVAAAWRMPVTTAPAPACGQ